MAGFWQKIILPPDHIGCFRSQNAIVLITQSGLPMLLSLVYLSSFTPFLSLFIGEIGNQFSRRRSIVATWSCVSSILPDRRAPLAKSSAILPALFGFVVFVSQAALAQSFPSPGDELIRRELREREMRERAEKSPDVRLMEDRSGSAERLPRDESPCFKIEEIRLSGDASEAFQWALSHADTTMVGDVDAARGACLGASGINLVIRRIQTAIISHGYVTTRVLAKPQDLNDGVLDLTLIPGRVASVRMSDETEAAAPGRARVWNALPSRSGDLLNLRDVEQGLENFKRVPSVESDIEIVPADSAAGLPGESDLVINWRQGFPLRLNLALDDSGTESTGRNQGAATVSWDHFLMLNDLLYLNLSRSVLADSSEKGAHSYTFHYSVPFGYWLLALTATDGAYYHTVAGLNDPILYSGTSSGADVELSRVFYRDANQKVSASISGWQTKSSYSIDKEELQTQRRSMAGWKLGLDVKRFIGDSVLEVGLNYKRGTGALGSLSAPEESPGVEKTGTSRPRIFTVDAGLTVPFDLSGLAFTYKGNFRGQWNLTPLVPQDRFSIGGRYTVRGFDGELILSAERGWLVRNDLAFGLRDTGQELYVGLDHGEVAGQTADLLIGTRLTGAVVGLRGSVKDFSYDVFLGAPVSKPEGFAAPNRVAGFSLNWAI